MCFSDRWDNMELKNLTESLKRMWGIQETNDKLCKYIVSSVLVGFVPLIKAF
jgi:hypothetical protein